MITLEADQPVLLQPEFLVRVGGDYAPNELVEVYRVDDPDQICAFYAQFISEGTNP